MSDKKQPEALRLAALLDADEWPGSMTLVSYARECVVELRRQHAELETLRAGYAAARLEIESLRAAQPAGAQQPGTAYAARPDEQVAFERHYRHLDLSRERDAWGNLRYTHDAVSLAWESWQARASRGQAPAVKREFTNELGNSIRITVEGPNSMHENIVTPMEAKQLREALNEHAQKSAPAGATLVHLDHIACIDGGELRYITGRKAPAYDCELYAMPNGGSAPQLYAAPTTQPSHKQEESKPHGWLYDWTHSSATGKPDTTYTGFTKDEAHARKHDNCTAIYTSPQPAPQQEAQEPVAVVVPCYTPSGKRVALYSAKQDLPIGTQLYTSPQPSPAAQGDALSDEAVRVPLDSLHADAAYLIGRLREGSMPYARVIEIIRERIDAAKAAIRARAAQGDALDAERLDWLTFNLSGKALRDIGVVWSEHGDARRAIDAARAAQEGK